MGDDQDGPEVVGGRPHQRNRLLWALQEFLRLPLLVVAGVLVVAGAAVALDESLLLLDGGDQARLSLANRRFHRALYRACGNELVVRDLDQMQDLISVGFVLLWERSSWPVWREEYDEHREILAAVQAGDDDAAATAAREHIERAMTLFKQHLHVTG